MALAGAEEWWQRAREELETARTLKHVGKALQAYHHAGQAVEFALKAVYIRRKVLKELPDECRGAKWHDLNLIATEAGLTIEIKNLGAKRKEYWLTVRDWDSNARFPGKKRSQRELNDLFVAVSHEDDGIMKWLESIFQKS